LTKYEFGSFCWSKYKQIARAKKNPNSQSCALLILGRYLGQIISIKIQALNKKQRKKVQKLLSYGRETSFTAISKITAILKTCEKNFLNFSKFKALI
jgi:hypothetical protein